MSALAEDHAAGSAWRTPEPRPAPEFPPRYRPCTPAEQAEHMAALTEGISGYIVGRIVNGDDERAMPPDPDTAPRSKRGTYFR
ncbi:hypothetical protein [Streptomyces coerulescens]|uniref:Uncharacterized protein n=1 Tax=Streptomyces coerulescens TaxID=29304 RepID=A0ABW0CPU5_STRCD